MFRSLRSTTAGDEGDRRPQTASSARASASRVTGRFRRSAWAPEGRLLADETLDVMERAIDKLPPAQRAVITMRDVQGFTSEEVCNALDLDGDKSTCAAAPRKGEGAERTRGVHDG